MELRATELSKFNSSSYDDPRSPLNIRPTGHFNFSVYIYLLDFPNVPQWPPLLFSLEKIPTNAL